MAFFSVSIDKDDAAWRKAMKEENMPWHKHRLQKAGKDVMKQYQFSGIPYILVLDKEGKIVAKICGGKALTDKLEELLSGKRRAWRCPRWECNKKGQGMACKVGSKCFFLSHSSLHASPYFF